jgi:entericidin B
LKFLGFGYKFILFIRRFIMRKTIFASLLATLFLVGAFTTLTGCNTIAGAGKDVEQGGKAVKDEANEHK